MKKDYTFIFLMASILVHATILFVKISYKPIEVVKKNNHNKVVISLNKLSVNKKQVVETEYTNIKSYEVKTDQLGEYNQDISKEEIGTGSKKDDHTIIESSDKLGRVLKEKDVAKDKLENQFDKEIDQGKTNSLKSKKFIYFGFYKKIKIQVDKEWNRHFMERAFRDNNLEVLVQVSVDSVGNILSSKIDKSSQNKRFDDVALNVFKRIKKVEQPPKELMNNQKTVYILWAFSLK
jgi:TonB family protein